MSLELEQGSLRSQLLHYTQRVSSAKDRNLQLAQQLASSRKAAAQKLAEMDVEDDTKRRAKNAGLRISVKQGLARRDAKKAIEQRRIELLQTDPATEAYQIRMQAWEAEVGLTPASRSSSPIPAEEGGSPPQPVKRQKK